MVVDSQPSPNDSRFGMKFSEDLHGNQIQEYWADHPIASIHDEANKGSSMVIKPIVSIDKSKDQITWKPDTKAFQSEEGGSQFSQQLKDFTEQRVTKAQLNPEDTKDWREQLLLEAESSLPNVKMLREIVSRVEAKFSSAAAVHEQSILAPGDSSVGNGDPERLE